MHNHIQFVRGVGFSIRLSTFIFFLMCYVSGQANITGIPVWWDNDIGKEEIVLPGFDALSVHGKEVILGVGRKYVWDKSVLPQKMYSLTNEYVEDNKIIIKINGKEYTLFNQGVQFVENKRDHVIVYTKSVIKNLVEIHVKARVEYDGLISINIELMPLRKVVVEALYNQIKIKNNAWTKMQAYELEKIHKRSKKVVFNPDYKGGALSVISLDDGNRSFWWFVDNFKNWSVNKEQVTEVSQDLKNIFIVQRFINKKTELKNKITINFNYLVTPVKKEIGNQRKYRFARHITKDASKYHGVNFWWINAFSHQNYPYSVYQDDAKNKITAKDLHNYPGLYKNRQKIKKGLEKGINILPYFSAHTLNHIDPVYQKYKERWSLEPVKSWRNRTYDPPFSMHRKDVFLSHNSKGYSDYLLYRFSFLIDELDMNGLYFDQGSPYPSYNSTNGLWYDSEGKKRMSTDILALRSFYKRLATLFYSKGKKNYQIFVHNSNSAIVPAFSFVSAMVQGEVFEQRLKNYDYINSVGIDEVRGRLSGAAFGIPSIWQELIYANDKRLDKSRRPFPMEKEEWFSSGYYKRAYNGFMSLALLHDIPTWSYAPVLYQNEILKVIDWVDPGKADFYGYWDFLSDKSSDKNYFSVYANHKRKKVLIIFSNLSNKKVLVDVSRKFDIIKKRINIECRNWVELGFRGEGPNNRRIVNGKNFFLVRYYCDDKNDINI